MSTGSGDAYRRRGPPLPRFADAGGSLGALTDGTALTGLSEAEAQRRLDERGPVEPPATSRSYASIVRANLLTVFNLILLVAGAVMLAFGDWRDALFLFILLANSAIGIAQEVRAKRALDRLAALVAPLAKVVRDGADREVGVQEVVVGDVVRLGAGDQVVADGRLVESTALALDESILTGEAEPVARAAAEEVRSGSFAVEGAGAYEVTAVGSDSYAERVAGEAREFRHPRSPLERALNRLLLTLLAVLAPLAIVLGFALWERDEPLDEAVTTAVAGGVTLIPEGLILLAAVTYAVAALRMTRRGALSQQLNAIESIASVDVVCLDKTGTLTEPGLRVVSVEPEEVAEPLARFAASSPVKNATLAAIAAALPAEAEPADDYEPFSSARRYSALRLRGRRYVLGAPELFGLDGDGDGNRVLGFGTDEFRALGRVTLSEQLRPEARETVEFFAREGVELKVLSGDNPATVAAVARAAGIEGEAVDGSGGEPATSATIVGRISPEGKRRFVERLRESGRYVAMVGDGVNDVPALKAARLGIAQGSGSQMARSVADVVLVRGEFGAVPQLVAEGRKILRNIQRVTKLFVAKSAFAAFLILSVGLTETEYPLLPRHLTLAATLTIGIPAFFLALGPSAGDWRTTGFLRDVARFAIPAGTAAGLGVLSAYLFALNVVDLPLLESRTVATTVLVLVGLYLVVALEAAGRRRGLAVTGLCVALLVLFLLLLVWEPTRDFFALAVPGPWSIVSIVVGTALAIAGLALTDERFVPDLRPDAEDPRLR